MSIVLQLLIDSCQRREYNALLSSLNFTFVFQVANIHTAVVIMLNGFELNEVYFAFSAIPI